MKTRKEFTTEEKWQQRQIAQREMFTHSYQHKRSDPDNCAACALALKNPNYSGWPLLFMAAGKVLPAKPFTADLKDAQRNNTAYYNNLLDYMANFGCEIRGNVTRR